MMKLMLLAVTLGTMLATAPREPEYVQVPPVAWADADPADSLYRAARRALTQKEYESAARLFDAIVSRYPRSEYAADAFYWKGFALYRNGNLDGAAEALEAQARRYPQATTRGDAAALLIQIKGQLARRGDASAQRDVNTAAAGSGKSCGDMEVQIAALDAMQQMDAERVLPLLRRVLARRDECSIPLRKNALFILAQKAGSEREKVLLDVAKSDPNVAVRQDAVFHLSQATSDAAIDALQDLLLHTEERGVRQNALFALAQHRSERARKIVKEFALSDNAPTALRNDAIFHLSQDAAFLKEAYSKVNDAELRANILFYIASRGGADVSQWLGGVIVDPKETMEQRKNALFHLASRHDAASLDKLIAIAKGDPNMELRKEALFHIGQSKDPRALKALEEIVAP